MSGENSQTGDLRYAVRTAQRAGLTRDLPYGPVMELEGHRLEIAEAGFTDTADTTAVWVPDLRLMIAGDVVYNDTHQYTAETTGESREAWARAAENLATYNPVAVIVGHKKPDRPDDPAILAETAAYFRDFSRLEAGSSSREELYAGMLELYPAAQTPALSGAAPGRPKRKH